LRMPRKRSSRHHKERRLPVQLSRLTSYLIFPAFCTIVWLVIEPGRVLHLIEAALLIVFIGEVIYCIGFGVEQ
jgi:hypothetical protein